MTMTNLTKFLRVAALVVLLPATACSDLLKVESPGRIADSDLGTIDALPGMVAGMKFDLSQAVDGNLEFYAVASMDLFHGGSYDWADIPRGIWTEEDIGGEWSSPQQARWVAETGVARMEELLEPAQFAKSGAVAQAFVYAGFANRILGDNFCSSVIDGGPEVPNTVHYDRGIEQFTQAIAIAGAAGLSDLVNAAYGGRAHMKAMKGDWAGAAADAAKVPASFEFYAEIDTEMGNDLVYETYNRFEYTAYGTFMEAHPDDPRAPWTILYDAAGQVRRGANGSTPHYQQQKWQSASSDVALTKGTEMLLLRAEAALRSSSDIATAYTYMNQARAVYGMAPMTAAANLTDAWATLRYERSATLWLEGRRLADLRRWKAETGPAHTSDADSRQTCVPISRAERLSNTNLRG
jgi:hypothetical protein